MFWGFGIGDVALSARRGVSLSGLGRRPLSMMSYTGCKRGRPDQVPELGIGVALFVSFRPMERTVVTYCDEQL